MELRDPLATLEVTGLLNGSTDPAKGSAHRVNGSLDDDSRSDELEKGSGEPGKGSLQEKGSVDEKGSDEENGSTPESGELSIPLEAANLEFSNGSKRVNGSEMVATRGSWGTSGAPQGEEEEASRLEEGVDVGVEEEVLPKGSHGSTATEEEEIVI